MPKDSDHRELTREELEQKQREKFNTFFTTSVAQVPEEMMNPTRAASQPDRKHGLLARFFGKRAKARGTPPPDQEEEEELFWAETPIAPGPTGEIMLDSADPQTEPVTGPSLEELTLELEGVRSKPEQARKEEPAPQPEQPPKQEAGLAAAKLAAELEKPRPSAAARAEARRAAARQASQTPAVKVSTARPAKTAAAVKVAAPSKPAAAPVQNPTAAQATPAAAAETPAQDTPPAPEKKPVQANPEREKLQKILDGGKGTPSPRKKKVVSKPEEDKEITQQVGGFHFFGVGEDEAPRGEQAPALTMDDTMSLELHEEEEGTETPLETPKPAAPEHAAKGWRPGKKGKTETAPEHAAASPDSSEEEPKPASKPEEPARRVPDRRRCGPGLEPDGGGHEPPVCPQRHSGGGPALGRVHL